MVRMVLGSILVLLAILMSVSGPVKADQVFAALTLLFLPGALLIYFGWFARAAKKRVVQRPHAMLIWSAALAAFGALFAIGILVIPNVKDPGAALGGLAIAAGIPAIVFLLSGWPVSPVALKPRAVRDAEKAAWEAEAARAGIMGSGLCAICGSSAAVDHYFYYPPVNVTYSRDMRTRRTDYNSGVNKGVSLCDRCVDSKRASMRPLLWLGVLISLPLCIFLVGVFGVIGFGMALWTLHNRNEAGDVIAYHWRTRRKVSFSFMSMEGNLTRKGFKELAARQGPQFQGGLVTK